MQSEITSCSTEPQGMMLLQSNLWITNRGIVETTSIAPKKNEAIQVNQERFNRFVYASGMC